MKRKIIGVILILLLLLAWLYFVGQDDTGAPDERATAARYADLTGHGGRLLVDFRDDVTEDQVRALERRLGVRLRPNSRFSWGQRLFRSLGRHPASLLERLRAEPLVERAELDLQYGIPPLESQATRFTARTGPAKRRFPNDPKYRYQWHLDQIQMPAVWPRATGKGITVAVIDTGVAYMDFQNFKRVPDLAQTTFVEGYDFINRRPEALDDHGHGTHVAGTIAQSTNNGVGVAGTAYQARIMPLKVLSARGFGNVGDIADAVRFAADHGARVINMSLGGGRSSKILAAAIRHARSKGVVVVCAAGNEGRNRVSFPAAYRGALAVAATQYDRSATFYSNYGKEIDLAAPGGNTRVDQNGDGVPDGVMQNTILPGRPDLNDYLVFMGTSMAAPHVAGAVALVMQRGVSEPDAVERLLKSTAKHPGGKSWDPHYGSGIVDVSAALSKAANVWGGYRLALALLLGAGMLLRLRGRGLLGLRPGLGTAAGLVLGSSGLFFLGPLLGSLPAPLATLLTRGLPSWDLALLGPAGHANPIFHSALLPGLLAVALYSVPRLRGLTFGLLVGVGAHLLMGVFFDTTDLTWLPGLALVEPLWLGANSLACLALARLLARR
jgi:serine protease